MPDGLTATPTPELHDRQAASVRRPSAWGALTQALVILAAFAVTGVLAGWLWYHLWDVPDGVVSGGQWYTSEAGLRDDFSGVAWYVTVAVVAGLVLGLLSAWLLARSELVTLAAVVVGSALAGYLMLRVGQHLSPADPHELARTAADGTRLHGALRVDSWPPRFAFPFGALVALAAFYSTSVARTPSEIEQGDSPVSDGTRR